MSDTLSFPGLGWSFDLSRVALQLGNFSIYWYGITFATGFLLGLVYFHKRSRSVGIHPYEGLDPLLWAIIGGVIGARLYFVVFQWEALYKANPMKVFAFREGGLAIYGGVIGAIVVGAIACRIKKIPLMPMLDVGLPALLLAQAVGRWGNFFNIEAFGTNTTMPWGMTSTTIESYLSNPTIVENLQKLGQTANPFVPVHPTFFYEFLWNLAGFLLLAFVLTPRRRYDGQVTLGYIAWYGLGRSFIEGLRTDSLVAETPWGVIRVSQYLAVACVLVALVALLWLGRRARSQTRPVWMGLYSESEASIEAMTRADQQLAKGKKNAEPEEDTGTTLPYMEDLEVVSQEEAEETEETEEIEDSIDCQTAEVGAPLEEPQESDEGGIADGKKD